MGSVLLLLRSHIYHRCSVKFSYVITGPSAWVCYHLCRVNISYYSWFMFRGQIISFTLIQNLACYSGDPKHVCYNENMDYFHDPYRGANKVLQGFARTATNWREKRKEIQAWFVSQCGIWIYVWYRSQWPLGLYNRRSGYMVDVYITCIIWSSVA